MTISDKCDIILLNKECIRIQKTARLLLLSAEWKKNEIDQESLRLQIMPGGKR